MSGDGVGRVASTATEPVSTLDAWSELAMTDDRAQFVSTAEGHLSSRFPIDLARLAFTSGQPMDRWPEIVGNEYPVVALPEEAGGVGALADLVALAETAGGRLLPVPLLATTMALQTVVSADLTPSGGTSEPWALGVGAGVVADDTVTVERLAVLDGTVARRVVVVLPGDGPRTIVAEVASDQADHAESHAHVDPGRPLTFYDFTAAPAVRTAHLERHVDDILSPARVLLAADLTGVAAAALVRSVDHAQAREQFGRKLGAFQSVKHRLADVYVLVERSRSLTRAAAVVLDDAPHGSVDARRLSLLAKAAAVDAAGAASAAYVQILGAMGMTFESEAHLYFRRSQQTAPFLGSAQQCYAQAARLGV